MNRRTFLYPLTASPFLLALSPAKLAGAAAPPPAPGSIPSRIILTWTGDPARTQAVTWRTEIPSDSPQAQIAKLTANPDFVKTAAVVKGAASDPGFRAEFTGLEPDTSYCYRVGDGKAWSEWNVFRTASAGPAPFEFLYFGDAQNSIKSLWSRTARLAFAAAPNARFMVHAGDLVAEGYDDRLWGEWSDALGFVSAMVPSVPVPGNHDLHRPPSAANSKQVFSASPLWRSHFALPANGPDLDELKSQCYYLDYQGVRFVALDVNAFANEDFEPGAIQRVQEKEVAWLNQVLGENSNRWTIVVQHQNIFSIAENRNYVKMRDTLEPIYNKYRVDLVLQGHDHAYARTHKIAGGKIEDPAAPGTIYATSVSGPKMYVTNDLFRSLMAREFGNKQLFQKVAVTADKLVYTAHSIDGAVVDRFELSKTGRGGSVYTDGAPALKA